MTAAAVCVRECRDGWQVLMVRSSRGAWIFPKGKVKQGEQPRTAAAREAREEAAWIGMTPADTKALGAYETAKGPVEAYFFKGGQPVGLPEPGRDPTWFSLAEARALIDPSHHDPTAGQMAALLDEVERRLAP